MVSTARTNALFVEDVVDSTYKVGIAYLSAIFAPCINLQSSKVGIRINADILSPYAFTAVAV